MMRVTQICACLGVVLLLGAAPRPAAMEFDLSPVMRGAVIEALDVAVRFNGEADGETILQLPNDWGGQTELYRAVRDLRAEGAEIGEGGSAAHCVLRHAPGARIVIRYRVVEDADGPPIAGPGNDYRVRVRDSFFFALGEAVLAYPQGVDFGAPGAFSLSWAERGAHGFASDLEHDRPGGLRVGDLIESVSIGGDVRVIDAGRGARLALSGAVESRSDDDWRAAFARIAAAQRAYWGAEDEPFLVTIMARAPDRPGSVSVGGTGRTDAFAFFATSNAPPETLDYVMGHEMMHTWTPRRIGGLRQEPNEAQDYWLSEGFTDWATMRVMARAGAWTPADFAARLNEFIAEYDNSPVRAAPNDRIAADYWNDGDVQQLPYRRGMLLASYWDARVRAATRGRRDFDDVLLEMQRRARREDGVPAVTLLRQAMRRVARIDITDDIERFVIRGEPVDLPVDLYGACGALGWIDRAPFHRGFDIEATTAGGNVTSGTIEGGPAWLAGLRDGMRLLGRRGGEIGDPDQEIAYEVADENGPRILRWMPRGAGSERVRRLTLRPDLDGETLTACQRRLGGL